MRKIRQALRKTENVKIVRKIIKNEKDWVKIEKDRECREEREDERIRERVKISEKGVRKV
jgi:hypothetical protein